MRVLVVSGGRPTPNNPLNGNFEFDQAEALANEGLEVTFFSIDLRSIRRRRRLGITQGVSGKVKWYEISLPLGVVPVKLFCLIGARALIHLYHRVFDKANHPDIIHAHFVRTGCMAAALSKRVSVPLIITEHSSDMNQPVVQPSLIDCAKKGYHQAKKVIAVGAGLSRRLREHTGVESVVIPNMIHMDVFAGSSKKPHNGFRLVTTSALIPLKRTENLIDAIGVVRESYDDVHLDIIGDGPLKEQLRKKVSDAGLDGVVEFHGYKKDFQIAEIYGMSDCFVLVSSTETFGVVFIEAMAAGLPVIATRCGGPEDFVTRANGILVDVDNTDQLVAAIIEMRNNQEVYDTNSIREYVLNKYSPSAIAHSLIRVYDAILA